MGDRLSKGLASPGPAWKRTKAAGIIQIKAMASGIAAKKLAGFDTILSGYA
jgi:hypothetical protein